MPTPDLKTKTYEGRPGEARHLTRKDEGSIPTFLLLPYGGARGEKRGEHTTRSAKRFRELVADIREHGIRDPIFVTVEPHGLVQIAEGNNRLDAAVILDLETVPVEIRAFGHGEWVSPLHQSLDAFDNPLSYHEFKPGLSFEETAQELRLEAARVFDREGRRMFITRHTVLGRMREQKAREYRAYLEREAEAERDREELAREMAEQEAAFRAEMEKPITWDDVPGQLITKRQAASLGLPF